MTVKPISSIRSHGEWSHGLGEIITALTEVGMRLDWLRRTCARQHDLDMPRHQPAGYFAVTSAESVACPSFAVPPGTIVPRIAMTMKSRESGVR